MYQTTTERDGPPMQAPAHADGIARVVRLLADEPDADLTVRQLAQLAHLSPYHFIRVFRQVTGSPPGDFRAALRLQEATRLLLTTTRDVTDICYAVGYQSVGTFTTRFTQRVGLSPGRLRALAPAMDIPRTAPDSIAASSLASGDAGAGPAAGAVVRGAITGADVVPGPLFVGLFPDPIAQGRPIVGTLLSAPGPYALAGVPDGCYYVLAAALPWSSSPLAYLLPDERLRMGRSTGPVWVRGRQVGGDRDLVLRPLQPTDPPLVVALPSLLCARYH
jgi:AraC family transcriptional regulator